MNLCVDMSEECGHGVGVVWRLEESKEGVEFRFRKKTCVSEEHGQGVGGTLLNRSRRILHKDKVSGKKTKNSFKKIYYDEYGSLLSSNMYTRHVSLSDK